MAYGELAGVSPVNGLYALLLPTLVYVLLGSSRQLVIGPEGSISALVAAAILPLAAAGGAETFELAAALAVLVGGCFLAARVLRLGWLADYFSRPVLIGYLHGVAIVLVVSQLGKVLGLDIDARNPLPQIGEVVRELGETSGITLAVGAAALGILIPLRYVAGRFPAALVVVVGAIAVSWWLDLEEQGVAVTGNVPSGIPDLALPVPGGGDLFLLLPAAVGIFLVSFADEILTARSFAGKHGQHVRGEQEILAMGAANVAAGLTQGFPIGASGSRTAVSDSMGVRTQLAGVVAAGTILLILLFLTDPISYLPKAVLGAVIIAAAIGLVDPNAWRGALEYRPGGGHDCRRDHRRSRRSRRARGARVRRRALDRRRRPSERAPSRRGSRVGRGARPLRRRLRAPHRARLRPGSSSPASTIGSSSPTPATSRAGCSRPCAVRPRRPGRSCSMPRR